MNSTKSILISVVIVAVVASVIYFFLPQKTENGLENSTFAPTNENSPSSVVSETSPTSSSAQTTGGAYETYSAEKLARANTGKVVLFFRASWCPTCRAVDADIRANLNSIPNNVTILDVNYDSSADLKRKYGVTYQHTFVQVDANGNQIAKWSGSPTLASLLGRIN